MSDPDFSEAVELIEQTRSMPPAEAVRYLFDRYRTAKPDFRDCIVLALSGAVASLRVERRLSGVFS